MRLQNLVNNEFVDPQGQKWFPHRSPITGEVVSEVPDSDVMDLVRTLPAANKAWTTWQKSEPEVRARLLSAIASGLRNRSEELAQIQADDEGTPKAFGQTRSVPEAAAIFDHYANLLASDKQNEFAGSLAHQAFWSQSRASYGVVTIITPSCDPYVSFASRVAPALAAGNVVILKPSEHAPLCAQKFAEVILQAKPPAGVFNLIQGRGGEIGSALLNHPGLSILSFTGSTETGRIVRQTTSESLKRTHLALGARNPVLVFDGVDLKKAAAAVANVTLQFHGPTCLRGSRLFVQESIYKEFLEHYKVESEKFGSQLGPLNREADLERFNQAVAQAVNEKGKVLFGGMSLPNTKGFFVQPTAIFDLTNCSTLQQEEIVGPFVTIASFKYQHDAIKQANTSPFAQAAYIFEPQGAKALRIARKLESARIFINTARPLTNESLNVAGQKDSGIGQIGSSAWLEFFSRTSLIAQNTVEL